MMEKKNNVPANAMQIDALHLHGPSNIMKFDAVLEYETFTGSHKYDKYHEYAIYAS